MSHKIAMCFGKSLEGLRTHLKDVKEKVQKDKDST